MKIKVTKVALMEGLQRVQNVVALRSTLPILSNVLLTAQKGKLYLATTDLEVSVRCGVEATIGKPGSTTLPARRLLGIAREMPDKPIEIEVDEKNVATVNCEASYFKIIGMSEDEFPPMAKPEGKFTYHLKQGTFKEMLLKTAYAASTDETRHVLNGVLLSFKGGQLTVVATDGRRLALVSRDVEVPKEAEAEVILPTKAVSELLHTLGDEEEVRLQTDGNKIAMEFDDVVMTSKVIEGTYPNFKQVIPTSSDERITLERETLLTAMRRVSLVASEKTNATRFTFAKGKLVVVSSTPDVGEARETVPIKYAGKEITVAFNPEFVIDPLKNLECDEVYLEITDEMSPGVIKCESQFVYVLMPMRIG
jgi:DNA polymerase-3 subunit beta